MSTKFKRNVNTRHVSLVAVRKNNIIAHNYVYALRYLFSNGRGAEKSVGNYCRNIEEYKIIKFI